MGGLAHIVGGIIVMGVAIGIGPHGLTVTSGAAFFGFGLVMGWIDIVSEEKRPKFDNFRAPLYWKQKPQTSQQLRRVGVIVLAAAIVALLCAIYAPFSGGIFPALKCLIVFSAGCGAGNAAFIFNKAHKSEKTS